MSEGIHQYGAGAALAVVAALLRAREAQMLPQGVEQSGACVDPQRVRRAVHLQGDFRHDRRLAAADLLDGRHANPPAALVRDRVRNDSR
jgi:hypothetical protein